MIFENVKNAFFTTFSDKFDYKARKSTLLAQNLKCIFFLTVAILHQFVRQIALTWQLRHYRNGNFDYPKFVSLVWVTFPRCRIRRMILCEEKHEFPKKIFDKPQIFLLAFFLCVFTLVCAEEELSIEQLNSDDSEDKLEQYVYDQDVDDIL